MGITGKAEGFKTPESRGRAAALRNLSLVLKIRNLFPFNINKNFFLLLPVPGPPQVRPSAEPLQTQQIPARHPGAVGQHLESSAALQPHCSSLLPFQSQALSVPVSKNIFYPRGALGELEMSPGLSITRVLLPWDPEVPPWGRRGSMGWKRSQFLPFSAARWISGTGGMKQLKEHGDL